MSRHPLSPWMNELRKRRTKGRATRSSPCISLRRIEYLPGDLADFELALCVFGLTRNPGDGVRQPPDGVAGRNVHGVNRVVGFNHRIRLVLLQRLTQELSCLGGIHGF